MTAEKPSRTPDSLGSGVRLPFEALGLLRRERGLWPLAALPALLSVLAFTAAIALLATWSGEIHGWATAWMPVLEAGRWYQWLWIAPAKAGLAVIGAVLFLFIAGAAFVLAYLLASLLASPVHDALSARVEQIVTGGLVDAGPGGLAGLAKEALRSLREELRRMLFFLALTMPLFLIGALIPGASLVTGPLLVGITIFFLPLDYSSYTLDRRRVPFAEKRRWMLAHRPVMVGFGATSFLTFAVPGLNFLAMPVLVVAGTLLAVRLGPAGSSAA